MTHSRKPLQLQLPLQDEMDLDTYFLGMLKSVSIRGRYCEFTSQELEDFYALDPTGISSKSTLCSRCVKLGKFSSDGSCMCHTPQYTFRSQRERVVWLTEVSSALGVSYDSL